MHPTIDLPQETPDVSTADRPSTTDRAAAYAAWRNRLTQQVEETKVIDLSVDQPPASSDEPAFDWSTDALFAESRRLADDDAAG